MELVLIAGAGIGGLTPRGRVLAARYPRARGGAGRAAGTRGPRRHSGRRQPGIEPRSAYALVSGGRLGRSVRAVKPVGFAYPGSNPGSATTCENSPLTADTRLCGAV